MPRLPFRARLRAAALGVLLASPALVSTGCDDDGGSASGPSSDEIKQAVASAVQDGLTPIRDEQKDIKDGQAVLQERLASLGGQIDGLVEKLDALDSKIDEIEIPAPTPAVKPTGPKPGRPDPAATYKVLVGDAHSRGPDTALVTIVTWSDFQ